MIQKRCKNCYSHFWPRSNRQVFCSEECRAGWKFRKDKRKLQQEQEAVEMEQWREKREKGLKISVCKNCLSFSWQKEPTDFCSEGCRIVYNGH